MAAKCSFLTFDAKTTSIALLSRHKMDAYGQGDDEEMHEEEVLMSIRKFSTTFVVAAGKFTPPRFHRPDNRRPSAFHGSPGRPALT